MSAIFHEVRIRRILETIESGSLFTIQDLAIQFKLNASHLRHLFKEQTGSRLGQRLVERRLQRAALLLVQGDLSVTRESRFSWYFLRDIDLS